jgi:MerR family transcriptional regulator/heat shock protein HspR
MAADTKHRPVYVISIAAELVDMHPQTLRLYERKHLIRPGRSSGKTRLYSERDIDHLREIRRLTQELGVNLAGVEEIMRLRHELDGAKGQMEGNVRRLQQDITERMTSWRTLPSPETQAPEAQGGEEDG